MTVWRRINKAEQRADKRGMIELEKLKRQGKVRAISIDEMWSYVGKKGKRDRHKLRKNGRVNRNEALHSKLKDKLVAFKRRTKAFFRSFHSLRYALALFTCYYLFG